MIVLCICLFLEQNSTQKLINISIPLSIYEIIVRSHSLIRCVLRLVCFFLLFLLTVIGMIIISRSAAGIWQKTISQIQTQWIPAHTNLRYCCS